MKYIYYILLIWVIASLALTFVFHKTPGQTTDVALQINDRTFSPQDLEDEYNARPYNVHRQEELVDRIITREILIQEALQQEIDLDESFRRSMKSYYEQSLTKVLLERQAAALAIHTDDAEIKRFIELMDKDINISLFNQDDNAQDKLTGPFLGFSSDLQMTIIAVPRGDLSPVITVQGKTYRLRLDMIANAKDNEKAALSFAEAAALIDEYKKKQAMQAWLDKLRKRATVRINIKDKKTGGE